MNKRLRSLIWVSAILIISGCYADLNSDRNIAEADLKSSSVAETSTFKTVNPGENRLKIVRHVMKYGDNTFDPENKGVTKKLTVGESDSTVFMVTQATATDYIQPPYVSIAQNGVWKLVDKNLMPQGFHASDFTYANDKFLYFQKDSDGKAGLYQYRISNEGELGEGIYIPTSTDQELVSRVVKTTKGPAIVVKVEGKERNKDVHYRIYLANNPDAKVGFIDKFGAFSFNNVLFDLDSQKAYYISTGKLKMFDMLAGEPVYQDGKDKIFLEFDNNSIQMEFDGNGNLFILEDNLLHLFDCRKNAILHSIELPIPILDPILDPVPVLSFRDGKLNIWYYQDYERKASLGLITVMKE